ncbi:MAG: hypothetical protein ACOCXZ_02675, partial [Chloroflexota bacterium]
QQRLDMVDRLAAQLNTTPDGVAGRVSALQDELSAARKQIDRLRRDIARANFSRQVDNLEQISGVRAMILQLEDTPSRPCARCRTGSGTKSTVAYSSPG